MTYNYKTKILSIRIKHIIWIALIFFNSIWGYSQIVNNGILHISDSTTVYFENEFTNKSSGTFSCSGDLYLDNNFTNVGAMPPCIGKTYYKCIINSEIDTIDQNLIKISSPKKTRLTYLGKNPREFQINAALSQKSKSENYTFFISKNGSKMITETNTLKFVENKLDKSIEFISGTVELALNEYIEIWAFGQGNLDFKSINLNTIKISLN